MALEQAAVGVNLDAGAIFVLKSRGSWLHCGYHLTTSIVAPALLSLPFAMASLGWAAGAASLATGTLVTFYSYNLLSLVLEHHAQMGNRQLRFRDMANHILGQNSNDVFPLHENLYTKDFREFSIGSKDLRRGFHILYQAYTVRKAMPDSSQDQRYKDCVPYGAGPVWGRLLVGPIQFAACYGAVVGGILLGGQSMKSIYFLQNPNGDMKLYEFVALFGVVTVLFTQIPSFHSLRHINLVSLLLCIAYSACATAGSIHSGLSSKAEPKDYSLSENSLSRLFAAFNGISVIATCYGNGIIPEIQATLASPVKGKMFKGLCVCYSVVVATFFSVAVSCYWAFGNTAEGSILNNFVTKEGKTPSFPRPFLFLTYLFTLLQVTAVVVVYLQPSNEILEGKLADAKKGEFSMRNVIPRIISRSLTAIMATVLAAAMLPFFGDINALIGAFGFIPLDFVLPMVFYNVTFMPLSNRRSPIFWLNTAIAAVFSAVAVMGMVSAVRQILLDAHTYSLFANM